MTSDLRQMMLCMLSQDPSMRPHVRDIVSTAAARVEGRGPAEVDSLATYVLGHTHDVRTHRSACILPFLSLSFLFCFLPTSLHLTFPISPSYPPFFLSALLKSSSLCCLSSFTPSSLFTFSSFLPPPSPHLPIPPSSSSLLTLKASSEDEVDISEENLDCEVRLSIE